MTRATMMTIATPPTAPSDKGYQFSTVVVVDDDVVAVDVVAAGALC